MEQLTNALRRHALFALFGFIGILTGCGSMSGLGGSSEFQCKAPEGIPCQSISGVHYNERAGNLPAQRMGTMGGAPKGDIQRDEGSGEGRSAGAQQVAYRKPASIATPAEAAAPLGAIRSDPTVIRIWVAPWEDADGDLNDQSYVYLQIDSGRWLIEHNRAQIRKEFAPQRPAPVAVAPVPAAAPGGAPAVAKGLGQQPQQSAGPTSLSKDEAAAIGRALAQGAAKAGVEAGAAKSVESRP